MNNLANRYNRRVKLQIAFAGCVHYAFDHIDFCNGMAKRQPAPLL